MEDFHIVTVVDEDLGAICEVRDSSGGVIASASVSPRRSDGTMTFVDETQVFHATGSPIPLEVWDALVRFDPTN